MATPIQEAKSRLREAVRRLAEADRNGLEKRDRLAYNRIRISADVWRAKVRKLERELNAAPQRSLFSPHW